MKKTELPASGDARATAERRSGTDRRRLDALPPGGHDRRRSLESRKPEVVEVEMSTSLWDAFGPAEAAGDDTKKI